MHCVGSHETKSPSCDRALSTCIVGLYKIYRLILTELGDRDSADLHTFEEEFCICMAESIQLKLPFLRRVACLPAQSGDLSNVVVFSVYTIYLNSIITDNLLANFKAKCA